MQTFKRTIALILTLIMVFSIVSGGALAAESEAVSKLDTGDMTIEGTNGFGTLLSQEIQESQEESASAEEDYEAGYSVIDLTFEGSLATVEYSSLEEAILVVALYSEDGMQMLASGTVQVSPDEDLAYVTIEGDMPEYFQASAYLVDTYDLSPLCAAYDTPMYTREMQELLASTIHDYDADRVLNLDEDETTNFAVYAEDTIVIQAQEGVNAVASVDDENSVYVIENADEIITSLAEGDVFVYPYGEGEILIIKVASIQVNGKTVTITGSEDLETKEVFSHVKIEGKGNNSNLTIDASNATEGIKYEENTGGITPYGLAPRKTESSEVSASVGIVLDDIKLGSEKIELTGGLELNITIAIEYYISMSCQRLDISKEVSLEGTIGISGALEFPINLGSFNFEAIPGVLQFGASVRFVTKIEAGIEASLTLSLKSGIIIEHGKQGFYHNKYCTPDAKVEVKFEGKLFMGLEVELGAKILYGALAEQKLTAEGGIEYTLERKLYPEKSEDEHHLCDICFSGEAKRIFSLECSAKFLKMEKRAIKVKMVELTTKMYDIYYTPGEMLFFQEGHCPNLAYKLTVNVVDANGNPVMDAAVSVGGFNACTGPKGIVTPFLPVAEYEITVQHGDIIRQHTLYLDSAQKIKVRLSENGDPESSFEHIIPDDCIDDTVVYVTGRCGDDVFWSLDNRGMLWISGTGPMWNYSNSSDTPWYNDRSSITEVIIECRLGDDVTTIGDYAFSGCENLHSVSMGDNVTIIGGSAFSNCTSLTSVKIPDSVTAIGNHAFYECTSLTSVKIPDSVTIIGDWAFMDCDSLTSVTVGNSVTTIGDMAFAWCDSLTEIIFRGSAPTFGDIVFSAVTATAYYPAGNATWIDVMYGSAITWVPYTLDENGDMVINEAAAITVAADAEQFSEETEPTEILIENAGEDAPTLHAAYGGDYSSVATDTYTLKTASFSGLVPGEQYVLLAMISIDVEDPLAADNLLYIDQAVALEDGTLVFQYVQRTPTDTSYVVACGASSQNLNDAEITFPEMVADGEIHAVNPTVVYDGKTLIEGQDYTILGTVSFTEPGTYTCYIRGVRNYAGLVECTYTVVNPYYEVASGTCGDNLTWTFYDNGRLTISGTGPMAEFSDYSSAPWDDRRSSITTVIIDQGVTTISDFAFTECSGLTSVVIGDSVTAIGDYAFDSCISLTSVTIPDSVTTIGSYVFRDCTSLTSAAIGDGVTSISTGTFQYCGSLTSVTIGDSVNTIKYGAFKSCTSLTSVTIPDSVTTIGNDVFSGCTCLTSVTIPDSVTTIGDYAFSGCTGLTGIYVNENNLNYSSDDRGVLFDKEKVELIQAPSTINSSYEIPDSVTTIGDYAFSGCTSLTSVIIPDSVTTISSYAFRHCTSLSSVTIPDGVTAIGDYAFSGCTSLSQITFMGDAPFIDEGAFSRVTATSYYLVGNPTWTEDVLLNYGGTITWEAYECTEHSYGAVVTEPTCTEQGYTTYTCTKCGDIHVADEKEPLGHTYESATTEDGELNYNCTTCGDNYIEATLATLQYVAYEDYVKITGYTGSAEVLVIPAEIEGLPVTVIGSYAFSDCSSLTSVTIPDGVTVIGLGAFQNCWMLTNVTIPESVTAIGKQAFMDCESLSSITIPDSVTSIAERTFENCKNLRSINIPNGVTTIDYRAFYWCVRLASVMLPDSVTEIGPFAFCECTSLTSIYFDGHAPAIDSDSFEGVTASAYYFANITSWTEDVFQNYGGTITWTGLGDPIPSGLDYVIYADHVEITSCHRSLTEVVIPAKIDRLPVTVICDEAFQYDDGVKSVSIPDSVTYIGDSAFEGCSNLTTINIPDSVTYIGKYAFKQCDNLNCSINIPDGITYIGDYAFYCCYNLTGSITIPVSLTSMGMGVFAGCASLTGVTIQDGVTAIVDQTFSGCSGLTSINIPDSVISIGERAFENCDGVTSIDIPASVTSIGSCAFEHCSKLKSIRFIGDAPEFGRWVFSGVYGTAYYPGDNPTWTTELMENCEDYSINWVAEGEVFGMEIVSAPEYGIVGLAPDLSELCVEFIYGNDIHRPVANSKLRISEIDTTTAGKQIVTVSYDDFSSEFTYGVHEALDVVLEPSLYPESAHNYGNNLNETQTLTWSGADCLELVFSEETFVENNFDKIYVYDGNDDLIISYTGAGAAGVTLVITGDTVKIRLTSDTSSTDYGYSFTSITAKNASHTGTVIIPDVEATCTESGQTEGFICEICDQEQSTVIPALGHEYIETEKQATCTEGGYKERRCSRCSEGYTYDETGALGHKWTEWITTKEPTETETGLQERRCTNCTEVQTEELPVIVPVYLPGDITGDGKVNARDAARLMQVIAGWDVEYVEAALDVNGDGKVNARDAARLQQYLAGWDVEIN